MHLHTPWPEQKKGRRRVLRLRPDGLRWEKNQSLNIRVGAARLHAVSQPRTRGRYSVRELRMLKNTTATIGSCLCLSDTWRIARQPLLVNRTCPCYQSPNPCGFLYDRPRWNRLTASPSAAAHDQALALASSLDVADAAQGLGEQDVAAIAADPYDQFVAAERQLQRMFW